MPVGHLDIGMGVGDAQVFGHNPVIQQYAGMLAQRKAKEDADNKYLAEQLASVKPDGLRNDADRANFYDKYAKIKDQAIAAENIHDPRRKVMEMADIRQKLMDLGGYVNESKQQAVKENQFAQAYMANPTAFSNEAIAAHRKGVSAAVDSPDVVKDYTQLARNVDANKIEKEWQGLEQQRLKEQQWGTPNLKTMTVAGRKGTFIYNSREVPVAEMYELGMHRATADPEFDRYLQQQFPQQYGQGGRALAVKSFVDGRPKVAEFSKPEEKQPLAPDRFYAHEIWKLLHGVGSNTNERTPTQIMISGNRNPVTNQKTSSGIIDNDPQQIQKFIDLIPQNQYREGHKPDVQVDPNTGVQTWIFPQQVEIDPKIVAKNEAARKNYDKNPEYKGENWLGFGGTKLPFEQSSKFHDPYKVKKDGDAKTYTIDPNSPDASSEIAKMGVEQHVNFKQLNDVEQRKSGRGQIQEVQPKNQPPRITSQAQYNKLPKGAKYLAPDGTVYTKQ